MSALSCLKAISCVLEFYFHFKHSSCISILNPYSLLSAPDSIITACTLTWVLTCYFSILVIRELYKVVNYHWAFWAFHQLKPLPALLMPLPSERRLLQLEPRPLCWSLSSTTAWFRPPSTWNRLKQPLMLFIRVLGPSIWLKTLNGRGWVRVGARGQGCWHRAPGTSCSSRSSSRTFGSALSTGFYTALVEMFLSFTAPATPSFSPARSADAARLRGLRYERR